jgi:hypothetical protein
MSLFSIELLCDPDKGGCGYEWDDYVEREERNREDRPCPSCGEKTGMRAYRTMRFSSTERHLSKAELDRGKPLVEAMKLEKKVANMNPSSTEAADMKKEIKYLKSSGGPKT